VVFCFLNREILVQRKDGKPQFTRFEQIDPKKTAPRFIGVIGDMSCFTAIYSEEPPRGFGFENRRSVYFDSDDTWRPAMSTAVLVADWDLNHRFCGRCGEQTIEEEGEWCRTCPSCGHSQYPRISPAVIVAILKEGKILLAHNRRFTAPVYSLIAGFAEPGEFLEDTVRREVCEETGLAVKNIRYFASQSWPFPDSLMIGFIADYDSGSLNLNGELADAAWFTSDAMPNIPGHGTISRRIIDWYLETGGDGALPADTEPSA
jgi:NAD+ diphosphatase